MKDSEVFKFLTKKFGGRYQLSGTVCYECHLAPPHETCDFTPGHRHVMRVAKGQPPEALDVVRLTDLGEALSGLF